MVLGVALAVAAVRLAQVLHGGEGEAVADFRAAFAAMALIAAASAIRFLGLHPETGDEVAGRTRPLRHGRAGMKRRIDMPRRLRGTAPIAYAGRSRAPNVASGEVSVLTMKGKYGLKALIASRGARTGRMGDVERDRRAERHLEEVPRTRSSASCAAPASSARRRAAAAATGCSAPRDEVKVGHALRVIEGPLAPIACASRTAHVPCADCPDETVCAVRLLMLDVRNAITGVLDETSLADMRALAGARARRDRGDLARPDRRPAVRP